MIEKSFVIIGKTGMTSRVISSLVSEANKHRCESYLSFEDETADMKSIMNLMSLVIKHGDKFVVRCDGDDEVKTIDSLESVLVEYHLI